MKNFLMCLKLSKPIKHHINILVCDLKLKDPIDWPKILLVIIVTFELLQHNLKTYVKRL